MLIKLDKEIKVKKDEKFELEISNDVKPKVKQYWEEFIKNKTHYWDGDIIVASEIDITNGIVKAKKTKYSNLVYSKTHDDIEIRPLYTAIFLKTLDNKYIIRKDNHDRLGLIGGMADLEDFEVDSFNSELCLKREMAEETNIDIYNKKQLLSFECKYFDLNNKSKSYAPAGFIYVGKLNYTSKELLEYMEETQTDGEIKECFFCTLEECINIKKKEDELTFLKEFVNYEINDKQ